VLKSRLFNKDDHVYFGDTKVEIPKLTVAKWKALFETIETLPSLIVNILAAKGSKDFTATAVVASSLALDEIVKMVSAVTGLDVEFIENNADHNDLFDFIVKIAKKNDLGEAAKKFQNALGLMKVKPSEDV
jgi:hypothetical protein